MKTLPPLSAIVFLLVAAAANADEVSAKQVEGFVVQATIKQAIGSFGSHGFVEAGDTLELDLSKLPNEKIQLTPGDGQGSPYIPFRAPLLIERVNTGKGTTRTVIDLSSNDADRKLRIRIIVEKLAKESTLKLFLYTNDGFVGSMAEAEGILK